MFKRVQNKQEKSEKKRYSKLNFLLIRFLCRIGGREEKITKGECKCQGEKRNNSQKKI